MKPGVKLQGVCTGIVLHDIKGILHNVQREVRCFVGVCGAQRRWDLIAIRYATAGYLLRSVGYANYIDESTRQPGAKCPGILH